MRKIITKLNVAISNNCDKEKYDEIKEIIKELLPYAELEEDLGISLLVLFKAIKNGIYLIDVDVLTKKKKIVKTEVTEFHYWGEHNYRFWVQQYSNDFNVNLYGEHWALTKKELL